MFKKKKPMSVKKEQGETETANASILKFPRPKILLMDMEDETEVVLKAAGYNVSTGSFGVPYKVPKSDSFQPVIANGKLPPGFTEQEIIVIDLVPADPLENPRGEKHTSPGENDWWASCNSGVIDPRSRSMAYAQDFFNRIRSHGGTFIIFAHVRDLQKLIWGHTGAYNQLVEVDKILYDNWCFLSVLDSENLEVSQDHGREIFVTEKDQPLVKILPEYTKAAHFLCTVHPTWRIEKSWITLARNKYGAPVAGAIVPGKGVGWVFILPRLQNKPAFLLQFFNDVLPELSPHLFPHVEGARWVQRPEYELPKILEFKDRIQQIQDESRKQIVELEKAIEEERHKLIYLHDLIRETGTPLVSAVKKALEVLGFQSILDMDEEMKKSGSTEPKREDLQIHDGSPTLLVEVKGISGLPKDAEALQVWKYIAPRMREWGRTDIQGLSIINHQRNLPALDRDNKTPFREDILTNAQEQRFGLLTTWDLFRMIRSYVKNEWKHENIKALFYQNGRIDPAPKHYEFIGVVEHFWEKAGAVGVQIKAAELKQGDRIAFELPVEFEEQDVESLQVENEQVAQAILGMLAGIKTHLTKEQAKKGTRVFRLIKIETN